MSQLLNYLQNLGFSPQKVSTAQGGEYSSSCPACGDGGKGGDSDRFHIWPEKPGGGLCIGRFWCRQCGASGDTIEFLKRFHNMDFQTACMELGISLPNNRESAYRRYTPSPQIPEDTNTWRPRTYPHPSALWQQKAGALLKDCRQRLVSEPEMMSWLARRGINAEMVAAYGLGYNRSARGGDRYRARQAWGLPEKIKNNRPAKLWIPQGWVIPSFAVDGSLIHLRIRRRDEDIARFAGDIKYLPLDGSSMATMILHPEAEVFVPVECGFDAILIAGMLQGKIGTVTTWNASARPDVEVHAILSRSVLILNGLDYDAAGNNEQKWWNTTYKQNIRLEAPAKKINDPGEAFAAGVDIRQWVIDALPVGLQIKLGFKKKHRVIEQPAQETKEICEEQPLRPADENQADASGHLEELRAILRDANGYVRIYDDGYALGPDVPRIWAEQNPQQRSRLSWLLTQSEAVGRWIEELGDGLYGADRIPG